MNKKFLITAASISVFILILVLILSPKKKVSQNTDLSSEPRTALGTQITTLIRDNNPLNTFDNELNKKLPLYQEGFKTSVDLDTNISIYRTKTDKTHVVHLEIFGISYVNTDSNEQNNPNVTAFKEAYLKSLEMIEGVNVDPKKLTFIYSDKPYIQKTSEEWIDTLKLKP